MSKAEEHFNSEPPHTAIKHKLFKSVLESCVSISNNFDNRNKEKRQFLYMDLYAGCGKFKDENLGSPLIALTSIDEHIKSQNNNFDKINLVVSEYNQENAKHLKANIENYINNNHLNNTIECSINAQSWEECKQELSKHIKDNKWGFIFVDPFSIELKLPELIELISANQYFKDILILINKNAQERVLGREDDESLEKISSYFGEDIRYIRRLKNLTKSVDGLNNTAIIQHLISRSFVDLDKDFVINLAITRTRENELENADRFYLCLITSSIGVANVFLNTYANILNEKRHQASGGQLSIFDSCTEVRYFVLSERIKSILLGQKMQLFKLVLKLYNDFYSWKDASPEEIPSTQNIKKAINLLLDNKQLEINNLYLDKRKLKNNAKNLTMEAFKTKENMKRVLLTG